MKNETNEMTVQQQSPASTLSTAGRRPGVKGLVLRNDRQIAQENQQQTISLRVKQTHELTDSRTEDRLKSAASDGAAIAREEATATAVAYFEQRNESRREFFDLVDRVDQAQSSASIGDAVESSIQPTFGDLDLSFLGSAS
jgi:hypothetical protein